MCIAQTISSTGIKVTFNTKDLPLNPGLKAWISGEVAEKPKKEAVPVVKKAVRLSIATGEPSPQAFLSIEGFFMRRVKEADEYTMDYRKYWNAKARKPKGKKPSRATIRGMYIH